MNTTHIVSFWFCGRRQVVPVAAADHWGAVDRAILEVGGPADDLKYNVAELHTA